MSLLWPERLLASLEPHALAWARRSGRGALAADPHYGPEPWHGVLEAFKRQAADWRGERVSLSVVLSNAFVRYTTVPDQGGAATREEEAALAHFQFAKIHGERARGWDVRLSPGGSGVRLACAIDAALLGELKACFGKGSRARLVSVQPFLMSTYNHWRARIPRDGAWLVLPEQERVCIALVAGGGWRAPQIARGPADWREIIERERQRAAGDALPGTALLRPASLRDLLPVDDAPQSLRLAA